MLTYNVVLFVKKIPCGGKKGKACPTKSFEAYPQWNKVAAERQEGLVGTIYYYLKNKQKLKTIPLFNNPKRQEI